VPAAREMYKRLAALDPDFPPPGSRWEEPTLHDIVSSLGMTPPASALHSDRCNEVLCSSCRNRNVLETTPNPGSDEKSEILSPSEASRSPGSCTSSENAHHLLGSLPPTPPDVQWDDCHLGRLETRRSSDSLTPWTHGSSKLSFDVPGTPVAATYQISDCHNIDPVNSCFVADIPPWFPSSAYTGCSRDDTGLFSPTEQSTSALVGRNDLFVYDGSIVNSSTTYASAPPLWSRDPLVTSFGSDTWLGSA
jgi:hypothetical protein